MSMAEAKDHYIIRRKQLVTVTYYSEALENGKFHRYGYTTKLLIGFGSSMREIAKTVIKSSIEKKPNWIDKVHEDQPIIVYLKNRNAEEIKNAPFGICYDITKEGNVKFLSGYDPLSYDWTYKRITELYEAGYISGDINHIIVETPDGLGAPGSVDFSTLIDGLLLFIGVVADIEGVLQIKDRIVSKLNYRKMVKGFKKNGLYRLKQIRQLLETNREWSLKKVMKALSVNRNVAILILKKLGYTHKNGKWFFDNTSIESLDLRKKWLAQEEIEEKEINKMTIEWFSK